jgi:hypothetical protein
MVTQTGFCTVYSTELVQDMAHWWLHVNTAINLQIPHTLRFSLTKRATIIFSWRATQLEIPAFHWERLFIRLWGIWFMQLYIHDNTIGCLGTAVHCQSILRNYITVAFSLTIFTLFQAGCTGFLLLFISVCVIKFKELEKRVDIVKQRWNRVAKVVFMCLFCIYAYS